MATAPLPLAARLFAWFAFALALIGLMSFWPPKSAITIAWIVLWTGVCAAVGIAILLRLRVAPYLVWMLLLLAGLSALAAFRSGLLDTVGVAIDVLLFVPLIWFAIWFQRHRTRT